MTAPEQPPESTAEGRRVIDLLWNPEPPPGSRGPRPRLTLGQVVEAGIALADAAGLTQLSMRKVAAALDVGAMSLYTYVPGRDELVELMIDTVYAEHDRPAPGLGWRDRLESFVRESWALYRRHPWLLDHNQSRLPLGPNVLDVEESLYAALAAAGFTGADTVAAANFVRWQLLGAARAMIGDEAEARSTGVSYEAYWGARSSFWTTYFDSERYPTTTAIWEAGGFDDASALSLDRLLDRLLDAVDRARSAT
ncbi:TetR/AcrR family transcriptional regulator [Microlunatus ginsengisoli]|uniref:TetR/AcrR family transcriptional regulator n=1 Tax=Microlunatus ginsengisoli TaxID=363863 RepID=A0ABP7ADB2_9ACTN